MRIVPMFASLVVDTLRSFALAAQLRRRHNGTCHFSLRDLAVQHGLHHPRWKAAHFLPCTRPPDVMRMHGPPKRATYGPSQRRAFVSTTSGHLQSRSSTRPHVLGGTHPLWSKLSRHPLPRAAHLEGISSFCFFRCFLVHTLYTLVNIFSSMSL